MKIGIFTNIFWIIHWKLLWKKYIDEAFQICLFLFQPKNELVSTGELGSPHWNGELGSPH